MTFKISIGSLAVMLALSMARPAFCAEKPTLYLIGDSTVKANMAGGQGWGEVIDKSFDASKIHVENDALAARSSRTFFTEGLWAAVEAKLKPGDFVLMQFGHNDLGVPSESYRASLHGVGAETQDVTNQQTSKPETVHTYGWYMTKFVTDAKAHGAMPIIVSPVPRDKWTADKVVRNAGQYGEWSADVAKTENVPFLDLNSIVADKYDALGKDKVTDLYFLPDLTHTKPAGAKVNAESVVEGIKALKDSPLSKYLTK
ncbi:MAG: rhamnogalacturonan acetylesterase [Capsulimonas sp.]|jgi:rhamnogalacturonan acetylesterase|nr:rhamnogalacturonan acetylesterase [Capsulimonas sp.]